MQDTLSDTGKPRARAQSRRWLGATFFVGWTALAAFAVWWLITDAARSGDTVIRVSPGEVKAWSVRLHENVVLARLNFPWALAWIFLLPYVLWIGARFSFEGAFWRTRLPILLATGAGFVWASQWLSNQLGAGQAMIVMVNYSTDTSVRKSAPLEGKVDESFTSFARVGITNRIVTNRFTKVLISGDTGETNWEMSATEILSGLPTNLPHMLRGGGAGFLPPPGFRSRQWSAALDGLAYVALIGLAHAGVFYRRYREREAQASLLESRLNEARLRSLQAQLQPHFLFNTLNGIATLVRRDPATAEEMLLSLSDLLRIALSSSHRQEIPLREEMDFMERYLALQKMRFGERLQVSEEIDPEAMDCLVPALVLQPLVENAIRHGLEPSGRPGKLRIAGSREGNWLKLTVEDDGVGLSPGEEHGSGVGLANVRERLAALHGAAQKFSIAPGPQGGVVVNIKFPARTETAPVEKEEGIVT